MLTDEAHPAKSQLVREALFVHRFEESGTAVPVNLDTGTQDAPTQFPERLAPVFVNACFSFPHAAHIGRTDEELRPFCQPLARGALAYNRNFKEIPLLPSSPPPVKSLAGAGSCSLGA